VRSKKAVVTVLAGICIGLPGVGFAADWQLAAESDVKKVYINLQSLQREGSIVQAAAKEEFFQPQLSPKKKQYLSAKNIYKFDCTTNRVAFKSIKAYEQPDLQGKEVQKAEYSDKNLSWQDIPTKSMFEALQVFVCKRAP
jgi:hypothetical protein